MGGECGTQACRRQLGHDRKEERRTEADQKLFAKIEQDIRDRNRRSKRRLKEDKKSKYNDEFYVDKSRQIATMTAEKDLKATF